MASPAELIPCSALAISNVFYYAAFPGLVRDLPKIVKSQEEVLAGTKK